MKTPGTPIKLLLHPIVRVYTHKYKCATVATIAFMVFCVMMNIGSLRELRAIFRGFWI